MSAFYVGSKHINWLISYAKLINFELPKSEKEVGKMLANENRKSLEYRYPDDEGVVIYKYSPVLIKVDEFLHLQAINACDCYHYQSCEHPTYRESESFKFVSSLKEKAKTFNNVSEDDCPNLLWCIH